MKTTLSEKFCLCAKISGLALPALLSVALLSTEVVASDAMSASGIGAESAAAEGADSQQRSQLSYLEHRPKWGLEFKASSPGVRDFQLTDPTGAMNHLHSIQASLEFQPQSLQRYGVLGIGADFGLHPPSTSGVPAPSVTFSWNFGSHLRYQARFVQEQLLVPYVAYGASYWMYRIRSGEVGGLLVHGPSAGLEFLLNAIDTKSAARFFSDYGVSRTYIVVDGSWATGSAGSVLLSARSFYFGLRFEM
jgi:hypothetical protein